MNQSDSLYLWKDLIYFNIINLKIFNQRILEKIPETGNSEPLEMK